MFYQQTAPDACLLLFDVSRRSLTPSTRCPGARRTTQPQRQMVQSSQTLGRYVKARMCPICHKC